ncbi:NADH-Ubiquinone oxidoreductase ASHI subunit [Pediculus humanus corporis]|uniref:NADH-Ubiquinone oxidoreductase ASHI subunit n=1 Tax=Pediculus humanus subsp. corporis TaxID=121224 RepID=E0VNN5_PEDHC|nr:NADH-Ubiquinone oxidoreductase ASHI subunit [Pediculus humanus corporis]EEB14991.1 NADH-Ubiquinone oxidoreductase ASHI subunit [Pediculus humanus corporis]
MALILAKSFNSRLILDSLRTLSVSNVKQCHWYPDFKPGPYPKTEAERNAAARKYNLLPEEYQPMPDDGDALGDYPDLSHYKRYEDRDPYHHWDFPDMRRDFLEPVPMEAVILLPEFANPDSYNLTPKQIFSHLIKYVVTLVTPG